MSFVLRIKFSAGRQFSARNPLLRQAPNRQAVKNLFFSTIIITFYDITTQIEALPQGCFFRQLIIWQHKEVCIQV
jgi:hypothetical protein